MSAMKACLKVVALLAVLAAAANGQLFVQAENPRPSFGICAAEAGGGIVGIVLGAGLGWVTGMTLYFAGNDGWRAATVGVLVGSSTGIAGCAGGTCLMGSAFGQQGRFLPTLAYTAGTFGVGALVLLAGTQTSYIVSWAGAVVLASTPVVAVYGYNRSRPRDSYGSRFVPGSVGLASVRDAEGIAHPSLNVRLLSVRF
jgi:hypothetical protein